jgi:hypothetical protein
MLRLGIGIVKALRGEAEGCVGDVMGNASLFSRAQGSDLAAFSNVQLRNLNFS